MSKRPSIALATNADFKKSTAPSASLIEILDRVLAKGIVARGDITLSVADVDLIGISLNLLVTSVADIQRGWSQRRHISPQEKQREQDEIDVLQKELDRATKRLPKSVREAPEEAGLAKLALTIIELLKELMERQAMRRVEAGSLREEEVEKMGLTFQVLEKRLEVLRKIFGLKKEDLDVDLGLLSLL